MLLVTDDDRMGELAIPPEHAGDVYAFVVETTGEDDLQYEDLLVSSLQPALTVAVYTACTLRRDVAVRHIIFIKLHIKGVLMYADAS